MCNREKVLRKDLQRVERGKPSTEHFRLAAKEAGYPKGEKKVKPKKPSDDDLSDDPLDYMKGG